MIELGGHYKEFDSKVLEGVGEEDVSAQVTL